MAPSNVEIVRHSLEAFGRGEVEEALALAHEDIVSRRLDPDLAEYRGHDGLLKLVADWTEGFTDWTYEPEEFTERGDHVIVRIHQSGRGAESGVPVEGHNWMVYRVAEGKIVSLAIYTDPESAFAAAATPPRSADRP
jgi:ketosteroid isomerase-like protein